MKIVLDFDDTIFNTHRLMQEFLAVFSSLSFREKQFWDAYAECKEKAGDFDKEILINLFSELKSFNKKKVGTEIDFIISKSRNFVYPDFFDFVNNFNKKDLILLSFGTTDFQGMKIKNSGIISYFKEIIITQKDKTENLKNVLIKNEGEKIFFIDDKAKQVDKIKEKLPQIVTVKMERPQGGHINTESKLTNYIVKDLNEAKDIINNLNE
jgi:FMN phosphatase YigB (HAD superfamily)